MPPWPAAVWSGADDVTVRPTINSRINNITRTVTKKVGTNTVNIKANKQEHSTNADLSQGQCAVLQDSVRRVLLFVCFYVNCICADFFVTVCVMLFLFLRVINFEKNRANARHTLSFRRSNSGQVEARSFVLPFSPGTLHWDCRQELHMSVITASIS